MKKINIYLVILSFIVIIAIIFLADDFTKAVLIISLVTNFLLICGELCAISEKHRESRKEPDLDMKRDFTAGGDNSANNGANNSVNSIQQGDVDLIHDTVVDPNHPYGEDYDNYMKYKEVEPMKLTVAPDDDMNATSIDAKMNQFADKRRLRDKRAIDGRVSKTANYYKYHFDGELDETEKRVWWGNYDV